MMQSAPGGHDQYERPRFRQDLVAEAIDEQGARFIDVMDPDSGNIFRFYEVEYSLACGMDGERDVPGIVRWAQDELGLSPSQQEVRTVIATLGGLGFIAAGEATSQAPPPSPPASEQVPGVVIAPRAKAPAPTELEFGGASSSAPVPAASDAAVAAPGASAKSPVPDDGALRTPDRSPARPTPGPPATSSSEVSIDLSDHIAVRPDDVKEAVRASRVMAAVEVPQDVLDAIQDRPPTKVVPATGEASEAVFDLLPEVTKPPEITVRPEARPEVSPEVRSEARPEARSEARPEVRSEARPEARPEVRPEAPPAKPPITKQPDAARTAKPPVELPEPPVARPVPPPAPSARVSPVLIVLLILAVLGGGAFVAWKYVLAKQGPSAATTTEPAAQPVKPPPAPPAPPPAPESKIAMEAPAPDEIRIPQAGLIETILPDTAAVKKDDVIVRLVGDRPIEAEITGISNSVKRLQAQIDAITKRRDVAQAAGNKAGEAAAAAELAERHKVLAAKQELLATRTTDLEKFLIHAQDNGTFTPMAKTGQKIAADNVVAKIQREAVPVATFKVADAKSFAANASIEVAVGKGEQHVICTIADVQPNSVKVTCPVDPALTEGAAVTLKLVAATSGAAPAQPSVPAPAQPTAPTQPPAPAAGSSASN